MKIKTIVPGSLDIKSGGTSFRELLTSWRNIYQAHINGDPVAELIDAHIKRFARPEQSSCKQRCLYILSDTSAECARRRLQRIHITLSH